ncbi:MAG: hypothetical protein ACOCUS_06860 [Polyangiales bacterium]
MAAPLVPTEELDATDRASVKRWLGTAVGSLVLAGLLSLLLVVGRLPGLHGLFTDPLFFKRCLVVHVDLALIVWFYAFFVALYLTVPTRSRPARPGRAASAVGAAGVVAMLAAAGVPAAEPVLANYVPVVDAVPFVAGLVAFAFGVLLAVLGRRLLPSDERQEGFFPTPPAARVGLRAGGIVLVLAALTFAASVLVTSRGLPPEQYYELVAWGGGHVLQFASVIGMLAAWLILLGHALGRPPIGRRTAVVLFAILVAPTLIGPLLALGGTTHASMREGFTTMMRWGIFPPVLAFIALGTRSVWRAWRGGELAHPLRDPRILATSVSVLLTLTGFVIGSLIRGSNTMIPAHYHASIGAVTVAYMGVTPLLLERLGMSLPHGRRARKLVSVQPAMFGVGQVVFAIGFGMAGSAGAARKVYGSEQQIRSLSEQIGLGVMGVGGVVAVIGGVLFLWIVIRAWVVRTEARALQAEGELQWKVAAESIRSRG